MMTVLTSIHRFECCLETIDEQFVLYGFLMGFFLSIQCV